MTMGYRTSQSTNMCALDILLWVKLTDANGNSTELEIDRLRVWFSAAGLAVTTRDEAPASYNDPAYFNKVRTFTYKVNENTFGAAGPHAEYPVRWGLVATYGWNKSADTGISGGKEKTSWGECTWNIMAQAIYNMAFTPNDFALRLLNFCAEEIAIKESIAILLKDATNIANFDGTISLRIDPTWYPSSVDGLFYDTEYPMSFPRTPLTNFDCTLCPTNVYIRVVRINIANLGNPSYVTDLFYNRIFKLADNVIISKLAGARNQGEFTAEEVNADDFFDAYYTGYSDQEAIVAFIASGEEEAAMLAEADANKLFEIYQDARYNHNVLSDEVEYDSATRTVNAHFYNSPCSGKTELLPCAVECLITVDIAQTTPGTPISYRFAAIAVECLNTEPGTPR